ncbi:hypothetical protein DIPPA_35021 [Diplonema papillatum]|nr:hypothetical protein DIPPA_35021 [Diplonema papillatum]
MAVLKVGGAHPPLRDGAGESTNPEAAKSCRSRVYCASARAALSEISRSRAMVRRVSSQMTFC